MIDGSEKPDGWLNLELQCTHLVERRSNGSQKVISQEMLITARDYRLYTSLLLQVKHLIK